MTDSPEDPEQTEEPMESAARRHAARIEKAREEGDIPLARRLGQIGVLGWIVVLPMLAGAAGGRWIDRSAQSGIFWTAALMMVGLVVGCWLGWRWVQQQ